mmetsp:Transcript_21391/g.42845  ORF Transcript_21391/g.42845 Transcript_21391/m.42845 type:complete len:92 (-) Transcript_21391:34-309(-)
MVEHPQGNFFKTRFRVLTSFVQILDRLVLLQMDPGVEFAIFIPKHFHIEVGETFFAWTVTLLDLISLSSSSSQISTVNCRMSVPQSLFTSI